MTSTEPTATEYAVAHKSRLYSKVCSTRKAAESLHRRICGSDPSCVIVERPTPQSRWVPSAPAVSDVT